MQSTFIGRAGSKNKGRISRFLANKCSIASRIDCFSDAPTTKFGEALRSQVEERLAFYETGSQPTKNAAAMARVMELLKAEGADGAVVEVEVPKKEKKSKKRKSEAVEPMEGVTVNDETVELEPKEKKSKKSKKSKSAPDVAGGPLSSAPPAETTQDISMADVTGDASTMEKKKKKKDKKKAADAEAVSIAMRSHKASLG